MGEWRSLCEEWGFRFDHFSIILNFTELKDAHDFIEFLDMISTKFEIDDQ